MKKGSFWKNYGFLILMLTGIVAGCVVGFFEDLNLHRMPQSFFLPSTRSFVHLIPG